MIQPHCSPYAFWKYHKISHRANPRIYTVQLKSTAIDCKFSCSNCQLDLVPIHVKDQFICGLFNNTLQTDILAKASHLKALEQIIAYV